ncbi:MAG: hypothetical protein ACOX6I_00515, partial [Syntrophomonadaceae bacterium]
MMPNKTLLAERFISRPSSGLYHGRQGPSKKPSSSKIFTDHLEKACQNQKTRHTERYGANSATKRSGEDSGDKMDKQLTAETDKNPTAQPESMNTTDPGGITAQVVSQTGGTKMPEGAEVTGQPVELAAAVLGLQVLAAAGNTALSQEQTILPAGNKTGTTQPDGNKGSIQPETSKD